jgi:hypothetical protein
MKIDKTKWTKKKGKEKERGGWDKEENNQESDRG